MRFSDLDVLSSLDVGKPNTMGDSQQTKNWVDVNCNEDGDVLDNFSMSDGECSTERSDNSVYNNKTKDHQRTNKPKKRVMFKCGDKLVMIREIPPRDPSPDLINTEESSSYSESESTDSESEDSDEDSNNKVNINTEIKPVKRPNSRVARIIREAPIDFRPKDAPVRKPTKKRVIRKPKRESIPKESSINKSVEKISIKPKQIQLKAPEKEVPKVQETKHNKSHIKRKKITINRTESPAPKTNLDCRNSKIILSERSKQKPNKVLLDKREKQTGSPGIFTNTENCSEHCVITDIYQGTDQRPTSQSDKRLYSWLLANGRIPGPEQQSPCISPMYDTKQVGFTIWENKQTEFSNKSVVKAPT